MNSAEEIVKYWLQSKGYFLQSSINLPGRKEIDILAINKKGKKLHVEVSVSINSRNSLIPRKLAIQECNNKFKSISKYVEKILGKKFKRIYVRGKIAQGHRDIRNEYIKECKKIGVEVLKFEDIINEISATPRSLNSIIDTVQLSKTFIAKKPKNINERQNS